MTSQSRPEPMNASPHHSKVKVTLTLSDPVYVSGGDISGKMEVESRADLDSLLGIGMMMVELHAIQEVNSGDHSATSTFIHSRKIFQGPGLPPSNAVHPDYVPGSVETPLPAHHYRARRGLTTFFFKFPVPLSSPSSINFGPVNIRYEIQASVSVAWRGEIRLVTDKREVKIVESWDPAHAIEPLQAMALTEGGKIWAQATITNGPVVGGQVSCIDLQLRNYSPRWTSGVTVSLIRHLRLAQSLLAGKSPPNISDVATQVEFRGPEYSVPPGIEGIANLAIDIPRHSRGVKGGLRVDGNGTTTESFFEVRCNLEIRIDLSPGSEDTVINLPVTVYHALAVPEVPASPPVPTASPYPYATSMTPGSPSPPGAHLFSIYPTNHSQHPDSTWTSLSAQPIAVGLHNQHIEQVTHNWQGTPYTLVPSVQHSISPTPELHPPHNPHVLSTSYSRSPRLLPSPPVPLPHPGYIHPVVPLEEISAYGNPQVAPAAVTSPISQNFHLERYYPISPSAQPYSPSLPHAQIQSQPSTPSRTRPPPIQIPSLPNPYDAQGVLHSPRPVPSPQHSFHGPLPKSDSVSALERIADEVGKQARDISLNIPKGDAGVEVRPQGPIADSHPELSIDKTLPVPPAPSSKDKHRLPQRPRLDTLFATSQGTMSESHHFQSSTDNSFRTPPTPPIAAITPIKFPKAPTELSGLGANLGKDVTQESGLDVLERRLLAEVGTRKLNTEERPHVRSVIQPIAIPPSGAHDTVNDSAISSLTLADREGVLRGNGARDREQEDRDSDERTQHFGGGHSPSEDDRDARTQKGKSSRKLEKSRHSEEDLEKAGRRRERKKVKDVEGRKLRKEAKGRVAAWLGEIDISAPPIVDDPSALISPSASLFVPITESASFSPSSPKMVDKPLERHPGDISADRDVSAAPNPRSSGFMTISTLDTAGTAKGSERGSGFKQSPRRSSVNDFRHSPSTHQEGLSKSLMSRSPSAEAKKNKDKQASAESPSRTPQRLFPPLFSRSPAKLTDPETKYDVRSARGGKGGKVTQVASLWAAKANVDSATSSPGPALAPKKPPNVSSPARKPVPNVLKRAPVAALARNGPAGGLTNEPREPAKATTVPAVVSSSHAIPMLSSTASLARVPPVNKARGTTLPPMISETVSEVKNPPKNPGLKSGRQLGDLGFGQARLRDLIKKYQG